MTEPFALEDIVIWFQSKQELLGSGVSLLSIEQRTEHLPAVAADFKGLDTAGRINGWVSGEFDFEIVRVSDGSDVYWAHASASTFSELESTLAEFLHILAQEAS